MYLKIITTIGVFLQLTLTANAALPVEIKSLLKVSFQENDDLIFFAVIKLIEKSNPDLKDELERYITQLTQEKIGDDPTKKILTVSEPLVSLENTVGFAEEELHNLPFKWSGDLELNVLLASGKKSIQYYGTKGKLRIDGENIHHLFEAFFDLNRLNSTTDKRKFGGAYKIDIDFSDRAYVLGLVTFEADKYGSFKQRFTTSAGVGYRFYEDEDLRWDFEAGPSLLLTENHGTTLLPNPDTLKEFSTRASSTFSWQFSDSAKIDTKLVVFLGARNVIESGTNLKFQITGALHSKFSYDILYDKDAPLGSKTTDRVFRTGLVFEF